MFGILDKNHAMYNAEQPKRNGKPNNFPPSLPPYLLFMHKFLVLLYCSFPTFPSP